VNSDLVAEPIRILHLEDNLADAELITRELQRAGLSISLKRVASEEEFRQVLQTTVVDVILSDHSLPGFDGLAALQIAREMAPEVPFLFVSGSIGAERAKRALQIGATDFVLKDRLADVPSAVKRALARRKPDKRAAGPDGKEHQA
jgi:CheY-like chemotaxis protein